MADGVIIKDNENTKKKAQDRLVIGIQERDKEILEVINNKITPYKNLTFWKYRDYNWQRRVVFKVNSNKICKDLEKFGVIPRKSGKEIIPQIENTLLPHFIRGYFDGDGCCYNKTINKSAKHGGKLFNKIIFVCLNKDFLKSLKLLLNNVGVIKKRIGKGVRQDILYMKLKINQTQYFSII